MKKAGKNIKSSGSLSGVINIGKDTLTKLNAVGINTYSELKDLGTEKTFLRLRALDPGACLSLLYGIEGAIEGVKWHSLSPEKKYELQVFFNMLDKK